MKVLEDFQKNLVLFNGNPVPLVFFIFSELLKDNPRLFVLSALLLSSSGTYYTFFYFLCDHRDGESSDTDCCIFIFLPSITETSEAAGLLIPLTC